MKRTILALLVMSFVALGIYGLNRPSHAQDPAKENMTGEIASVLAKFVYCANKNDTTSLLAMVSRKPDVSYIADGEVFRGYAEIKDHVEQLFELRGKYQFQLGSMDIANVNGLALATGPYVLKLQGEDGAVQMKGAVTFLLEKEGKKTWKITHMHRSTQELSVN